MVWWLPITICTPVSRTCTWKLNIMQHFRKCLQNIIWWKGAVPTKINLKWLIKMWNVLYRSQTEMAIPASTRRLHPRVHQTRRHSSRRDQPWTGWGVPRSTCRKKRWQAPRCRNPGTSWPTPRRAGNTRGIRRRQTSIRKENFWEEK